MAQTRSQKEAIVKKLAQSLKNSKAVVFSDFKTALEFVNNVGAVAEENKNL